ncbi:MAG: hypothetical protein ABI584_04005 [Acidobacteriota bacterium]
MSDDVFPPGLEPPPPPPDLRERVLAAASRAFDAPFASDPWTRAFGSPALRFAWAASIAILAAAHVLLPSRPLDAENPEPPELRQLVRLPRIDSRNLPVESPALRPRNEARS